MVGEESSSGDTIPKDLDRKIDNVLDKGFVKRGSRGAVDNVTITSLSYHGNIEESIVHVNKIGELHSGEWTCAIGRLRQKSVNIFVISPNTKVS